jgi:hypothetical protein
MNTTDLVNRCHAAGIILLWDGEKVKARGSELAISELLPNLRTHKEELKAYFTSEAMEFYHERAAIAQYDGGLSRTEAESMALAETKAKYERTIH